MNKEDKQRAIGKVVGINSDRFTIELLGGIDNFNVNGFDDMHYFAQLNSYIIIPYQNYYIVAEVAGVKEKDSTTPFNNPTDQFLNKTRAGKYLEVLPLGTLKMSDDESISFDFGVSVYPALYSDALYIKETELDAIFNVSDVTYAVCDTPNECKDKCTCTPKRYTTLSIGKSTIFNDYEIKIDIDKFFGSHSAILGNTGSGKSCTISSIIQGLYRFKNYSATGSTFVFFDVNGEYNQAFEKLNETNSDIRLVEYILEEPTNDRNEKFKLPHWFLNFEEWALLLQASEKTQQPVLRNALKIGSLLSTKDTDKEVKLKNHIVATCCKSIWTNSPNAVATGHRIHSLLNIYAGDAKLKTALEDNGFNFQYANFNNGNLNGFLDVLNEFIQVDFSIPDVTIARFELRNLYDYLDLAILYEESVGNNQIRDYCSSLLTRAKTICERNDFEFLNDETLTIDLFKRNFLGLKLSVDNEAVIKQNQIVILNLHSVVDEVVEIITCVLSRIIYEALKEMPDRNKYPVNLVLEEAHRYIGDDPKREFLKANRIFERIAKEGRKFGLFLTISSQRPSELSKTVLSQCNNFIVHRIQNPEDLSHIRQITPHISEAILRRMPSIPTQTALIFGHAVNLPCMFKVHTSNPMPKSENNKISANWFKPKDHLVYNVNELQKPLATTRTISLSTSSVISPQKIDDGDDLPF